jgi:anti-sigma-K factor RskA
MHVKARHRSAGRRSAGVVLAAASVLGVMTIATDARAERIENQTAVFAALDKVTARISPLNAPLNATEPKVPSAVPSNTDTEPRMEKRSKPALAMARSGKPSALRSLTTRC